MGRRVFEEMRGQPNYYLTRCEELLLDRHAESLLRLMGQSGPLRVVELGVGDGHKTRPLLEAAAVNGECQYVPTDICPEVIDFVSQGVRDAFSNSTISVSGFAAGPELRIPDFSHLASRARDSVDVTLDGFLLRLAQKFAAADGEDDEELSILRDIKSVRVRNFEFDADDAYSKDDVESVRRQLTGPGWSPLAQVHRRQSQEHVDVFLNMSGDRILGLAVIASEPRSFASATNDSTALSPPSATMSGISASSR